MVPEHIRKIPRPKNTVVLPSKTGNSYPVLKRIGCKYDNGRRLPISGKVIGHIIDCVYVEKDSTKKKLSQRDPHLLKYGNIAFADSVGKNLYTSLLEFFHPDDAKSIYTLALLRTAFEDVKDYQVEDKYDKSWASILYPNVSLSKSTISNLLENIGMSYDLVVSFMKKRLDETIGSGTKILIDGMLKNNSSIVNSFSAFSYKGRIKGTKDISILAAIDSEKKEPLCIKVYPGNLPDHSNTEDFIREFNIKEGMVITDKGFPLENVSEEFKNKSVGYLHPIKRNSSIIDTLNLYGSMFPLKSEEGTIMCSTAKDEKTNRYYYLFRDSWRASKEEKDFISNKNPKKFDSNDYADRRKKFGTICFVSNMKLQPADVYAYYELRWNIELVFRMYKGILSMNTTRVHDDWSVIGTEFVNYLSTIMTCRMKNKIQEKDLFKTYTFKDIMERLADVLKTSSDENRKEWKTCSLSDKDDSLLAILCV